METTELKKVCPVCGREFVAKKPAQVNCSRSCAGILNRKNRRCKLPPKECIICGKEFLPWNKTQVTCASEACKRKNSDNKKKNGRYKYAKNGGLPLPSPKKKKPWGKCDAYERWEQMTLTELSAEIARKFPGMSFGQVRLLKEQGKLPDDFGKDVRGV